MRLIVLILLIGKIPHAQQSDFDLKNLKFKDLPFSTTKEIIVDAFGQGRRVETNYDCGFFASDEEGAPYYQLVYSGFNYIGSDKEKFFYLENVDFDAKGTLKVDYLENELSGETTDEDFLKIFGNAVKRDIVKKSGGNSILLYSKGSDDGAMFTFKDGRLVKLEYWTPC